MESSNSSDEDVFQCGWCSERFFTYQKFKAHKKSKVCKSQEKHQLMAAGDQHNQCMILHDNNTQVPDASTPGMIFSSGITNSQDKSCGNIIFNEAMNKCSDIGSLEAEQGNAEVVNTIVDLATELAMDSDNVMPTGKLTKATNQLQLIDHNYMFLHSQNSDDELEKTIRRKDVSLTCMLCSKYIVNIHEHLEKVHLIAKEKVSEFVSNYMKQFTSNVTLTTHEKGKAYTCHQCKIDLKSPKDLEKHVCRKVACFQCGGVFENSILLENHDCSTDKVCEDCCRSFHNHIQLMKHVCPKHEVAFCDECNVQFLNRAQRQHHNCDGSKQVSLQGNKIDETTRTRRCSHCDFTSTNSSLLLTHFRERHVNDDDDDDHEEEFTNEVVKHNTTESQNKSNNEKMKCRRCKRMVMANNVEKHRSKCQDGKGKICTLCNHYSRDKHDFIIHVDTHKIWLDLNDIREAKANERDDIKTYDDSDSNMMECISDETHQDIQRQFAEFQNSRLESSKAVTIDCSTLTLDDLNNIVKTIEQETPGQHLVNESLTTPEQVKYEDVEVSENTIKAITKDGGNASKDEVEFSQESQRSINTRKCKSCGVFVLMDYLPNHMLVVHNKIKLFRCFLDTCMQVFHTLDKFDEHVKSHPENDDMLWCGCKTCVKIQPSGLAKRNEIRKEKMRQYYHNMMYKCEICWSKFPTEAGLNKHKMLETHHYPCHVCGKVQVSVRQLKMHILTHDTTRHHLCDICGLGYKTSRDLKKHGLNHSDVRPYVCDSCGKAFPTKFKLNRHNLCVHNPVKAFACTHEGCERKFSRKDKLKDHLNTHLEVEPFKCPYCNKGFYRSDNLRDHEVLHTRNYRFKCNLCSKGYMRPKLLEVHKQREHSDLMAQDKQPTQDTTFPLYALYSQQQIQILPETIQGLSVQTVEQLQQAVNEQQVSIEGQYQQQQQQQQQQQHIVNQTITEVPVFDSL